ncbi:MAG: DNA-directed RNA polymerase subunit alpha [Victivallales bacterium]|nr:DNA-directed RNA polymerase subunit alpha [Victivallales bacterium]
MGILQDFPLPQEIEIDESTATETYGKFTAAPFQSGFGHTLGNALRRVLLSSLEGSAISAIRIDGVAHEFATVPKVVEDVAEIVLNMKKILLICHTDTPKTLEIRKDTAGEVTAADIKTDGTVEIINKGQLICTLDKDVNFRAEIDIVDGRGYRPAEKNKQDDQPVGTIPIDSLFSPVKRVRYDIGTARVGEATEMDSLELEIWTDGRLTPQDALEKSAKILKEHLRPFLGKDESQDIESLMTDEEKSLYKLLVQDVDTLNLSVRSQNCLNNADIKLIGELCNKPESKMLKYKNFGKKSLDEITEKLQSLGLDLGMTYPEIINDALLKEIEKAKSNVEENDGE